jgi:hypothetical protein
MKWALNTYIHNNNLQRIMLLRIQTHNKNSGANKHKISSRCLEKLCIVKMTNFLDIIRRLNLIKLRRLGD